MASGWMRVKQRAKQRGVELPLVISDHADWDELLATMQQEQRRAARQHRPGTAKSPGRRRPGRRARRRDRSQGPRLGYAATVFSSSTLALTRWPTSSTT